MASSEMADLKVVKMNEEISFSVTETVRNITQGSDGWYFNNLRIEPTPAEIEAWESKWCRYCHGGFLHDSRLKTIAERCVSQVPCPVCEGTGRKPNKDEPRYNSIINAKVISVSKASLHPDTLCPMKKITVEFYYIYEGQQDGRPPSPLS